MEFWRDAGARGVAAHLDVMPLRAAVGGMPAAFHGPLRISVRRESVVGRVIPIGAPFVYVIADVVEPIRIWGVQADALRPGRPSIRVIGQRFGRRIPPRIKMAF